MKYASVPNYVLEALAYLGARANGHTIQSREARLKKRGVADPSLFSRQAAPISRLISILNEKILIGQEELSRLFRDVEGFPYNSTGFYSPAFLLYYPLLSDGDRGLDGILARAEMLDEEQTARNLLISLSLEEHIDEAGGNITRFLDSVLSLAISPESRLQLVGLLRSYRDIIRDAAPYIKLVIDALMDCGELISEAVRDFEREIAQCGCSEYLHKISRLAPKAGFDYELRPFIFGPDTNLALSLSSESELIYCGILRRILMQLLSSAQDPGTIVYEAIKLLGDKTRFDILCALRERPAYGQELSEQLGLARNTIHHHMSKLLNAGLVVCTAEGNRVYYSLDKKQLGELLDKQRELLIGE